MPRIKSDSVVLPEEQSWQQIVVDRLRRGKLVPIIGNSVANDVVFGGHDGLVQSYVSYSGMSTDRTSLPGIMQVRSAADPRVTDSLALKEDYINFLKNRLFDLAESGGNDPDVLAEVESRFDDLSLSQFGGDLGFPNFGDDLHPLLQLASLDIPVFVTTSYHDFIEVALGRAGKRPRTEFCRWHSQLEGIPPLVDESYRPSAEEPLVYHLFGLDRFPDSMVLTEDDHLKFLVTTSQNVGRNTDPVRVSIRQAMSDSSLLLLGYSLAQWDLRALFWGLIVPRTRMLTGVVAIQLEPDETEKRYLQNYLNDFEFQVFWGSYASYMDDLYTALGEAS